jgi:hypothetical protein
MKRAFQEKQFAEVDTKSVPAVRREVISIFQSLFPNADPSCINLAFKWVDDAFSGRYADYQAIDTKYHDFEHTLQGTLCFVRLLCGYQAEGTQPSLTQRLFELGVIAILFHDTGYLKKKDDQQGTGAKYTLTHVSRSSEFAARLLGEYGFPEADIHSVQNMIRCTGLNADLRSIPFQSEVEQNMGFALGTADLLGQMAAEDYIEKLSILFQEFDESNRFNGRTSGPGVFQSAAELRRNTPLFWEKYVLPKIKRDFIGLYRFLEPADGENPYLRKIEANIGKLKDELDGVPA